MKFTRKLYLQADNGIFNGGVHNYYIDEDITVLTTQDEIIQGELSDVNANNITIKNEHGSVIIFFNGIKRIADTRCLQDSSGIWFLEEYY